MINLIVVFPRLQDAQNIRNLLVRNGIDVMAVCTSGAQVITVTDHLDDAIVVSGYKLQDMMYSELRGYLPSEFEMLVVASQTHFSDCSTNDVVCLSMPIKSYDFLRAIENMHEVIYRRRKKAKLKPKVRTAEEQAVIENAKMMLMTEKEMTEGEAHKYLQKKSMDAGKSLVETAHMILDLF